MSRIRTLSASAIIFCFGVFSFLHMPFTAARAALPAALSPAHFDWVCVTDGALVETLGPLADHRRAQGLSSLVVDLDQVMLWSPAGNDTIASLHWLAGVAAHQWGARYLLLGGSHALLPAPLFRLAGPPLTYDNPTDAYYRCLGGDWDANDDGFVAEWGQDAPDPHLDLVVGRLPVDDAAAVANLVAKIIAYEQRPSAFSALFVASHMSIMSPPSPCPSGAIYTVTRLRDHAVAAEPSLEVASLFEDCVPGDPFHDALNPTSLVETLAAEPHDLVHFQLQGVDEAWQLAGLVTVTGDDFAPLAGIGHGFLASMVSGPVADTRHGGVLASLLGLPGGGAVGAVAPSCMGYIFPHTTFAEALWSRLLAADCQRLGDAFDGALVVVQPDVARSRLFATTYWGMCLLGDPAMLLRPTSETAAVPPSGPIGVAHLRVAPNPFNPSATILFEVEAPAGNRQPARVEIFDLQGRRLATLLDESLPPGPREVNWDADAVSGVYLVRVTVGSAVATAKLTLLE